MSAKHLHLLLFAVLCASSLSIVQIRFAAEEPDGRVETAETTQALAAAQPDVSPVSPPPEPEHVTAIETAIEIRTPVETVANRGDAMLFESRALQGTPFDEAVVAPFHQRN